MDKFDDWKEWYQPYPWHWGFEEIKDKKYGRFRTPSQVIKGLAAVLKFMNEERKKDPNFEPPEWFLDGLAKIKPFFDKLRPIMETRLRDLAAETGHVHPLIAGQVINPPPPLNHATVRLPQNS